MSFIKTSTKTATSPHHYVRTILASLLGTLAVTLIILSIIVFWLGRTLTDTDTYVSKVGPLVSNSEVQNFVVEKVTTSMIENDEATVQEAAAGILGPDNIAGKTDEQLKAEMKPVIEAKVKKVITAPQFAELWENSNRDIHSQLINQLDEEGSTLSLNFQPLLTNIFDQLAASELGIEKEKIQIPEGAGLINVEGEQIQKFRDYYDNFQRGVWLIILLAVIMTGLAVWASVHHLKTLRRVALMTGIFTGIMALLVTAPSVVRTKTFDQPEQQLALVIFEALTGDLRQILTVIAIICISAVVGTKLYPVIKTKLTHK